MRFTPIRAALQMALEAARIEYDDDENEDDPVPTADRIVTNKDFINNRSHKPQGEWASCIESCVDELLQLAHQLLTVEKIDWGSDMILGENYDNIMSTLSKAFHANMLDYVGSTLRFLFRSYLLTLSTTATHEQPTQEAPSSTESHAKAPAASSSSDRFDTSATPSSSSNPRQPHTSQRSASVQFASSTSDERARPTTTVSTTQVLPHKLTPHRASSISNSRSASVNHLFAQPSSSSTPLPAHRNASNASGHNLAPSQPFSSSDQHEQLDDILLDLSNIALDQSINQSMFEPARSKNNTVTTTPIALRKATSTRRWVLQTPTNAVKFPDVATHDPDTRDYWNDRPLFFTPSATNNGQQLDASKLDIDDLADRDITDPVAIARWCVNTFSLADTMNLEPRTLLLRITNKIPSWFSKFLRQTYTVLDHTPDGYVWLHCLYAHMIATHPDAEMEMHSQQLTIRVEPFNNLLQPISLWFDRQYVKVLKETSSSATAARAIFDALLPTLQTKLINHSQMNVPAPNDNLAAITWFGKFRKWARDYDESVKTWKELDRAKQASSSTQASSSSSASTHHRKPTNHKGNQQPGRSQQAPTPSSSVAGTSSQPQAAPSAAPSTSDATPPQEYPLCHSCGVSHPWGQHTKPKPRKN